jgi:hypothetical protein
MERIDGGEYTREVKTAAQKCAARNLLSNIESTNNVEVPIRLDMAEVIQQATSARYKSNQSTLGGVILFVSPHVFRQVVNSGRQNCDLDFRTTGVSIAFCVLFD